MSNEHSSLSERLDRLEQQNRRLRWLLLCLPIGVFLLGAAAPKADRASVPDGTADAPAISFADDPKSGLFRPAPDTLALSVGGIERMRWRSDGNILIGENDPVPGQKGSGAPAPGGAVKGGYNFDFFWDQKHHRLHTRTLRLVEIGDPCDIYFQRVDGKYPRGPLKDGTGYNGPGSVPGAIRWYAYTPEGFRNHSMVAARAADNGITPRGASAPGELVFATMPENWMEPVTRVIIDSQGRMSMGGGGYGGSTLRTATYGLHQYGGGYRLQALATPPKPELTLVGGGFGTTHTYFLAAEDNSGNQTLAGPPASIDGPAKLTKDNYIRVTFPRGPGVDKYVILKGDAPSMLAATRGDRNKNGARHYDDIGEAAKPYNPPTRNATADMIVDGAVQSGSYFQLGATTDAGQPPAKSVRLSVRNNEAGKTQLIVQFASGPAQIVATEP